MTALSRWLAPAVLTAGFGFAALVPAPAQAQDDTLTRVIVDVADVVLRGGQPYYRHGSYGYDDRLIATRDRYGRVVYYRMAPRYVRSGSRYGTAYDYRHHPAAREVKCNKHGKCKVTYYDARYDRRGDDRYYRSRYDRDDHYDRYDRRWDANRQRWDD